MYTEQQVGMKKSVFGQSFSTSLPLKLEVGCEYPSRTKLNLSARTCKIHKRISALTLFKPQQIEKNVLANEK